MARYEEAVREADSAVQRQRAEATALAAGIAGAEKVRSRNHAYPAAGLPGDRGSSVAWSLSVRAAFAPCILYPHMRSRRTSAAFHDWLVPINGALRTASCQLSGRRTRRRGRRRRTRRWASATGCRRCWSAATRSWQQPLRRRACQPHPNACRHSARGGFHLGVFR